MRFATFARAAGAGCVFLAGGCTRERAHVPRSADSAAVVDDGCTAGSPLVVAATGIGPVRLGTALRDVAARCPGRDTAVVLGEGTPALGRILRLGGHTVVAVAKGHRVGDGAPITRVVTVDGALRTDRGIGVGRSVGDLRKAHGPVCAALGEEGAVVVGAATAPGVVFATTASTALVLRGGPRALERNPELVPDSAKITSLAVDDGEPICATS